MFENNIDKKIHYSIGCLVFLFSLIIYLLTTSKTTAFWDAGEFIPAALELGVPHPPGNPVYVLLGKFFTLFGTPVSPAFMVNAFSSVTASFAVLFTYLFTVQFTRMIFKSIDDSWYIYFAGIFAALFTAFSNSFWINAIEAEVYAGSSLAVNMIIWLTMIWASKSKELSHQNLLLLITYLFFLGFGFQQIALQIAPAVLFVVLFPQIKPHLGTSTFWTKTSLYTVGLLLLFIITTPIGNSIGISSLSKIAFLIASIFLLYHYLKDYVKPIVWVFVIGAIILGFSTHLLIILRANHMPYINESNPNNFQLFMDFLLRKQYGGSNFLKRNSPFFYQINFHFYRYFTQQFFDPNYLSKLFSIPLNFASTISKFFIFGLGFIGIFFHYKKRKLSFIYFTSFFLMTSIAMIIVMNMSTQEVRNRMYFFVSAYNLWTVWMALGLVGIAKYAAGFTKTIGKITVVILLFFPILNFTSMYYIHDRSSNYIPIEYAMGFLNTVEKNAILFTNGDNDTFPLWYAQSVFDPYATEKIPKRVTTHPDETTKKELERTKKSKELQRKGIRGDVAIINLSLINTPWYIRQLRDKDGVIFGWTDQEIERINPIRLDSDRFFKLYNDKGNLLFSIKLNKGQILYVRDLAIMQIVKNNFGKRPIYFAVTTPENYIFNEYWSFEGFVYKLVSDKKDDLNLKQSMENMENTIDIRSFEDKSFYKDGDAKRMSNFVSTSFYKLHYVVINYLQNYELAKKFLQKAENLSYGEHKKRYQIQLDRLEQFIKNSSSNPQN